MLIQTGLSAVPLQERKNQYWESTLKRTPNEYYKENATYRKLVTGFCRYHGLGLKHKWFEIRIAEAAPSLIAVPAKERWWEVFGFTESVFWAFQTPYYREQDGDRYGYYVLEPYECVRVINETRVRYGPSGIQDNRAGFLIPIECCHLAWTETSGGYSDHIHERPEVVKTQQQIDKESQREIDSKKILAKASDIVSDPKWEKAVQVVAEKTANK